MKARIEKQMALKGLLLLVLLANISWRPAMQSMNQTEQASTGETMGGGGKPPAPPVNAAPPALPDEGEQTPVAAPEKSKDATRATGEGQTQNSIMNVCGVYAYISFREINVDGAMYTAINIRPHSGGSFRMIDRKVPGGFKDNLSNQQIKQRIDTDNTVAIKNQLGSRCAFQIQNEVARAADSTLTQTEDDKKRIKRGQEECRLDSRGEPLTEIKKLECELRRLSKIDVNTDRRGAELRAMTQIEKIVKDIRPHLMKRLMSSEESVYQEGKDYLEQTTDTLKDLATDLMLNPARMAKIISSLQALETGGESFRRSVEFDEKVKSIKEEARQEMIDVESRIQADPRDPTALNDRVMLRNKLSNTYRALTTEAAAYVNPYYTQLYSAERMGLVPMSEFAQFSSPYQVLARDLNTLSNPQFLIYDGPSGAFNPSIGAIGTSYGQPSVSDFNTYRNNLAGVRTNPISPSLIPPDNAYADLTSQYANSQNLQRASIFGANSFKGVPNGSNTPTSQISANRFGNNPGLTAGQIRR